MSGKTSASRSSVRINGSTEGNLRRKDKASHRDMDPQALLRPEVVRRFIEARMCPYCDRGPFKVVALHTSRAHGVGPDALRDAAGLPYSRSLLSPEDHAQKSEWARQKDTTSMRAAIRKGGKRRLSNAAMETNRAKIHAIEGVGTKAARSVNQDSFARRLREVEPALRRDIEAGRTFREIALDFGVDRNTVSRWSKALGYGDGRRLPGAVRTHRERLSQPEIQRSMRTSARFDPTA